MSKVDTYEYNHCYACKHHYAENLKDPNCKYFCMKKEYKEIIGLDTKGEHNFPDWCPLPNVSHTPPIDVDCDKISQVEIDNTQPTPPTGRLLPERPRIVCLCGSGRFKDTFDKVEFDLTLKGEIVLTIGCNTHDIAREIDWQHVKPMLDELHKRKIDLCDYIFVVNVGGYIGESTRSEIKYATKNNKVIEFLSEIKPEHRVVRRNHSGIGRRGVPSGINGGNAPTSPTLQVKALSPDQKHRSQY